MKINNGKKPLTLGQILAKLNFVFWFTTAVTIFCGIAAKYLSNDSDGFGQIANLFGGLLFGFLLAIISSIVILMRFNKDQLDKALSASVIVLIAEIIFLVLSKIFDW